MGHAQRAVGRHARRLRASARTRRDIETFAKRRSCRTTSCARTAPRCRRIARWASTRSDSSSISSPSIPRPTAPNDIAATARADAYMNRQYLDPVFRGEYPAELIDAFGDAWPAFPDERLAAHPDALRLPRHQLLLAQRRARRARRPAASRGARAPAAESCTPRWTGRYTRPRSRAFSSGFRIATATARSTSPRTAPPSTIRRTRRRRDRRRSAPRRVFPRASPRRARRDRAGRRSARLLSPGRCSTTSSGATATAKRFGIVHVDFDTLVRTPKASARFYSDVIRTHGAALARRVAGVRSFASAISTRCTPPSRTSAMLAAPSRHRVRNLFAVDVHLRFARHRRPRA